MEALTSPNTITLMAGLQQTAGKGQLLLLNKPSECCQVPCGVLTCARKDVLSLQLPFFRVRRCSVLSHLLVRKRGGFFLVFTVTSLCELTWLITLGSSGLNCSSLTKQKDHLFREKISESFLHLVWFRGSPEAVDWRMFSPFFWLVSFFQVFLLKEVNVCETEILDFWEMLFIVFWR